MTGNVPYLSGAVHTEVLTCCDKKQCQRGINAIGDEGNHTVLGEKVIQSVHMN